MSSGEGRDRPKQARPKRASGRSSATTIVIVVAILGLVVGLLSCCGIGGIIIYVKSSGGGMLAGADLSGPAQAKVQHGMTLAEVEKIVGKGRRATASDLAEVNSRIQRFGQSPVEFRSDATKYVWRDGNTWYFGDFDNTTNRLVGTRAWSSSK